MFSACTKFKLLEQLNIVLVQLKKQHSFEETFSIRIQSRVCQFVPNVTLGTISVIIIQLCFVEYKYRAKRVQISHDICTRLIPPGRVKFKTLASQNFGKRNRWIINLLLDVLVCSIAVYFYSLFVF